MQFKGYLKFALMLFSSFVMMYTVMFLNVDQIDHVLLSTTRTYMTILMIAPMAVIMLLFTWQMYPNKKINQAIVFGSVGLFVLVLILLRTQTPINDRAYMRAMIPHHSSAILTSEKANLKDPETIKLAEQIIASQKKEIAQMKKILYRMEHE